MKTNNILLLSLVLGMMLVSLSIADKPLDKVKYYNEQTKTALIRDYVTSSNLIEVKLLTPSYVQVPLGYQKVAEFEINNYARKKNIIDNVEGFDVKSLRKKDIKFDYKYYSKIGDKIVDDFATVCPQERHSNTSFFMCEQQLVGTHIEEDWQWIDFDNTKELPIGKIRIGLFTTVYEGDKVDWIPSFYGKKISEWAIYEAVVTDYQTQGTPNSAGGTFDRGQCLVANKDIVIVSFGINRTSNPSTQGYLRRACDNGGADDACTINSGGLCVLNANFTIYRGQNFSIAFVGTSYYQSVPPATALAGTNVNWTTAGYGAVPALTYYSIMYDFTNITTREVVNLSVSLVEPTNNTEVLNLTNVTFTSNVLSQNYIKNVSLWNNQSGWNPILINDTSALNLNNITQSYIINVNDTFKWAYRYCDTFNACKFSENRTIIDTGNFFAGDYGYTNITTEGTIDNFYQNVSILNSSVITYAYLVYNNANYTASIIGYGDGNYKLSYNLTTPTVTTDTNYTFYWALKSDIGEFNTTKRNQTVLDIKIDNCTTYTMQILNFTLKDERTQNVIESDNSTVEIDMNIYPVGSNSLIINFSKIYSNVSYGAVCLQEGILNNSQYRWDYDIKYVSESYAPEYLIQRFGVLNKTNIGTNISLYDLLSTENTDFQITYKSSNNVPVEDAVIQVHRQYLSEGKYKVVEAPITDNYGQTVVHLNRRGVNYKFIVYRNGVIIDTFKQGLVFCSDILTGDCTIKLTSKGTDIDLSDNAVLNGLSYDLTFNQTTRTVYLDFTKVDNIPSNVTLINYNINTNAVVCSATTYSSEDVLPCAIATSYGNITFVSDIYVDGVLIDESVFTIIFNPKDNLGNDGVILAIVLFMVLVGMGLSSLVLTIILGIMGIGLAITFTLISNGGGLFSKSSMFLFLVVAGGIIAWKIVTKRQTGGTTG